MPPDRPFLNRLLRSSSVQPMTPGEVQDKVRDHDNRLVTIETWKDQDVNPKNQERDDKISKMDTWLTQVAEPALNLHDSKIDSLETRVSVQENLNSDQNAALDAVDKSIPGVADARISAWKDSSFDASCNAWFDKTSIDDKSAAFIEAYDLGPKIKKMLDLPSGIENYDVGELLGMFDRIGSKIEPEKTLAVGQPDVTTLLAAVTKTGTETGMVAVGGTTSTPTAIPSGTFSVGGTGTTGSVKTGSSSMISGKTIRNIAEIETRFTKLVQTYWMDLVGLRAAWTSDILPNLTTVKQYKDGWTAAYTFRNTYSEMVSSIADGSYSGLDGRFSSIADAKIKDMAKILGSTLSLPTDQAGFLSDMTTARSNLGGGKPRDSVLATIDFYFNNFKGFTTFTNVLESASAKQAVLGHVNNWLDSDAIKKKLNDRNFAWLGLKDTRTTIEDYFTDFWNNIDLDTRVGRILSGLPAWTDLTTYRGKFPMIAKGSNALGDLRDSVGNAAGQLGTLATNLRNSEQQLRATISKCRSDGDTISDYITETAKGNVANLFDFGKVVHVLTAAVSLLLSTIDALDRADNAIDAAATGVGNIRDTLNGLKTSLDGRLK